MKKKWFAMFRTAAIVAVAGSGLTACVEESTDLLPESYANAKEVPTQFVFSVSTGNTSTRMSAANTQAELTNDFRGIHFAKLLTFRQGTRDADDNITAFTDGATIKDNTLAADRLYDLATVLGKKELDQNPSSDGVTRSRRVLEIALPAGTNTLLFYGKAIKDASSDETQGRIDYTVDANPANTKFRLVQRLTPESADAKSFEATENLIACVMTNIIWAGINATGDDGDIPASDGIERGVWNKTATPVTYDEETTSLPLLWANYLSGVSPISNTALSPLEEVLRETYDKLITSRGDPSTPELRAGSGSAIARTVTDLMAVVSKVANATPTDRSEAYAKALASRITAIVQRYFTYNTTTTSYEWKTVSELKGGENLSVLTAIQTTEEHEAYGNFEAITKELATFPNNYGLPMGATVIYYIPDNKWFDYTPRNLPMYAMGGGNTDVYQYVYPAELCYFGNSPLRVSPQVHDKNEYPDGVANWIADAYWPATKTVDGESQTDWTKNTHVISTTRSVAMRDNINYGTALLKTTVRYGTATLKDNNSALNPGEADATIDVQSKTNQFQLTGFVIGGQCDDMGWNFVRRVEDDPVDGTGGKAAGTFDKMVYDHDLPSTVIKAFSGTASTDKSTPNYTLLFDNYNSTNYKASHDQDAVYVALEFLNNTGKDFWGQNNIIRNGGTFYIIGKLNPAGYASDADGKITGTVTWPTNYALPPYAADGTTIQVPRVFIQDYVTTADFVIGENSLKYAMLTVPDLRSTQVSLGLSVDLKWETGIQFEDIYLGK